MRHALHQSDQAKKSHGKGTITQHTNNNTQTDFATTRPTQPRGPSWWKILSGWASWGRVSVINEATSSSISIESYGPYFVVVVWGIGGREGRWHTKKEKLKYLDCICTQRYERHWPYLWYTLHTVRSLAHIYSSLTSTMFSEPILRQSHTSRQRKINGKKYSVSFLGPSYKVL